jgi:beta-lactamase superfamily II metal-dependent hydrolase
LASKTQKRLRHRAAIKPIPSMKKALSLLFVVVACLVAGIMPVHAATGFLKIHMLSVADGRGDCFIIELPDNSKMVVDIPDGWNTALVNKLQDLGFGGGIKYLVGTHEHIDHIGGMNNFLNSGFNINNTQIYYPKGSMNANSGSYNNLVTAAGNRGLAITKLVAGDYIINTTHDGKPFKVRVLSPANGKVNGGTDDWNDPNEASFIIKVQYGTKAILLQADCWGYNEMEVLAGPYASEINACQVLKVGHHGTAAPGGVTSTRGEYLDAAGVTRALITDGDKAINDTIKSRLQARNIRYWSTGDGDGYCWLRTDGASNWEEGEDPLWPAAPAVVAPSITSQPASQTVNPGANVTFSVTASGTAPLGYQWRLNGVDIAEANAASFTISNVQSSDAGNYSVIVENAAGDVTSANAVLTVRVPPSITTQPASQTVTAGGNVTFSVSATGTAPLSYQWRFNGANIAGATAASLAKSNVQSGDAGNYSVVVNNAAGSATSANAALTVNVPPSITTQPSGQTVNPGATVTFSVTASGTAPLSYQWTFNAANIAGANAASLTKSNVQGGDAGNYAVVVSNVAGSVTSANAVLSVNVPPSITTQPASQSVNAGSSVTFTVTASGTAPLSYQWAFNGVNIAGANAAAFTKTDVQSGDAGNYAVVVSNVAGSVTSANAILSLNVPPSITTQPSGQTVNPGANVTFSVTASGTAPLSYQWTFNGANIAGENASSLTKSNVQSGDAGNYAVVVSNVAGTVTSANAALSVNVPPSITTQPASQSVVSGGNVTFSVVAAGTAPLTYQWRFAGVNIAGQTGSSLTKTSVQSSDAGNYSVVVANAAGSVTSANAVLTVTAAPPSISTQPASQTVVQGTAATFSVVAGGTAPLTYQWRFNGANISGATTSSYTRSNAQTTHQGNYSVVVANSAGSVTSANASLTVKVNVILDNSNAGFTASATWTTGTSATDKYGTNYRYRNTASVSDPATWAANLGNTGSYTVSAWWSQGINRSTNAPYIVYHSTGSTTVYKNQQANGGTWQSLGVYNLTAGTNRVSLSCWTTTGFVVIGDAVKWSQ